MGILDSSQGWLQSFKAELLLYPGDKLQEQMQQQPLGGKKQLRSDGYEGSIVLDDGVNRIFSPVDDVGNLSVQAFCSTH